MGRAAAASMPLEARRCDEWPCAGHVCAHTCSPGGSGAAAPQSDSDGVSPACLAEASTKGCCCGVHERRFGRAGRTLMRAHGSRARRRARRAALPRRDPGGVDAFRTARRKSSRVASWWQQQLSAGMASACCVVARALLRYRRRMMLSHYLGERRLAVASTFQSRRTTRAARYTCSARTSEARGATRTRQRGPPAAPTSGSSHTMHSLPAVAAGGSSRTRPRLAARPGPCSTGRSLTPQAEFWVPRDGAIRAQPGGPPLRISMECVRLGGLRSI